MTVTYKKIMVAVDGSDEAEWALKKGIEMAKRNNAEMVLAHIIDTRNFPTIEAYDVTIRDRSETYADELMETYKIRVEEAGVKEVTTVIDYGSPKVKIPKEIAKKYDVDIIVCGATGLNAVERFLIGSVSEHITRYAACDVLVVRTPKDE
jgi:nucleotide-binding universal stress UspA family protein